MSRPAPPFLPREARSRAGPPGRSPPASPRLPDSRIHAGAGAAIARTGELFLTIFREMRQAVFADPRGDNGTAQAIVTAP